MAVRVLLVADDVLARAGLLALLGGRSDLVSVGQASSDHSARFAEDFDVVLWDAGAGGLDASWLEDSDRPVVAMVADLRQAGAALAAGAQGVLPRDAPADRVGAALVSASAGLLVVDETFAEALLGRRTATDDPLVEPLTPREIEVLGLLAEGLANKTIAARLAISESTVKFHVNAILGKLGAENRSEAIVQAARRGLVAL